MTETILHKLMARRARIRLGLIGITFVCPCFVANSLSNAPSSVPRHPKARAAKIGQIPPIPRQQAQNLADNLVRASLEMKENVDFLLTPAILVQEALASDVLQTYPSE